MFDEYTWIVVFGGLCCFLVAFGIGANDLANAFATSVGAKSLTLKQAVAIAAVFEFLGAVAMGSRTTDTVRKGITSAALFNQNEATLSLLMIGMCCVLMSVSVWLLLATYLEMPVSTTHSCIGGIIGMALAAQGSAAVNWDTVYLVIASWFISPILSGVFAALLYYCVRRLVLRHKDSYERSFKLYPVLIGVTIVVNCFFVIYKGSPALGLKDTPIGVGIGVSFGVGIVSAVTLHVLAVPFIRKRVASLGMGKRRGGGRARRQSASSFSASSSPSSSSAGSKARDIALEQQQPQQQAVVTADAAAAGEDADVKAMKLQKARAKAANIAIVDPDAVAATHVEVQAIHDNAEKFLDKTEAVFTYLQVFTAILDSFSHGANDVANSIGPFATIYGIYIATDVSAVQKKVDVPVWILALGGLGIVAGLALYGYKIISAIGVKLTKVTPSRGFSIELGAALVICVGSYLGLPLSTTHCQVGATVGVGFFETARGGVNWRVMAQVAFGWVITLVFCGVMSAGFFGFAVYSPSMKFANEYVGPASAANSTSRLLLDELSLSL